MYYISAHERESTTSSRIQIGGRRQSGDGVDSGQCFGEFSGGNEREWTNFGSRPKVVSRGPKYTYL